MHKNGKKRKEIRHKTDGKCYYCGLPMMRQPKDKPGARQEWLEKHGFTTDTTGARGFCRHTRETIEHLTRKCDGGRNNPDNLVLAHQFCNSHRRGKTPSENKRDMRAEINNPLSPLYIIKNFYGKGDKP